MTDTGQARAPRAPLLIGLTGPIGCGKSTVARILGDIGGTVIDADALARQATEPDRPTLPLIRERFGDQVFTADGALDRAALASVVFEDAQALVDLERIVHPEVRRSLEHELDEAAATETPFVVIEAIKLVEGGLADRCDEVWLIECAAETQRARLIGRGAAEEDADSRIAAQGAALVERLEATLAGRPDSDGTGAPRVRRVSTEGSLAQTTERTEDALADALDAYRR